MSQNNGSDRSLRCDMNRRTFIGAATGVGLAAAGALGTMPLFAREADADEQAGGPDETVYSWCRGCVLPPCGIKVDVKNGVVDGLSGTPGYPTNNGALCPRGNAAPLSLYNPYRVKTPVKRTNPEKGLDIDPGWVEISWDEAYSTIAQKLKEVRDKDPREFVFMNGFSRVQSMIEGEEWCTVYGTPNYIECDGPTCSIHFGPASLVGNFLGPTADLTYCNYLIQFGRGETATSGYAMNIGQFSDAVNRGMKVVAIDPRCTIEGSKGEWVPIKPGADMAFILAMQEVMVHEIGLDKLDVNFIKQRTNAPYLIGDDGHYIRDAETKKPLIWNAAANQAVPFDDASVQDYVIDGEYEVNGQACRPAFVVYADSLKDYTPEWAEEVSTVPASTIRRIANEFVDAACIGSTVKVGEAPMPYRPVAIEIDRGAGTQQNGALFNCATIITMMLVGCLDYPGGGIGTTAAQHRASQTFVALAPDADGTVAPKLEASPARDRIVWPPQKIDGHSFFPYGHDCPHLAIDAILDPETYYIDYKPRVMSIWGGNPILHLYSPSKVEEALKKMEFIFTISYSLDEPTMLADIVLPESTGLERYAAASRAAKCPGPNGSIMQKVFPLVAQQVVTPIYDSKQPEEIWMELADRLDMLTGEDGLNAMINSSVLSPVKYTEDAHLDINKRYSPKELANVTMQAVAGPDCNIDAVRNVPETPGTFMPVIASYPSSAFPMGKTRYALYMETLLSRGENLVEQFKEHDVKIPGGFTYDEILDRYSPVAKWIDRRSTPKEGFDLMAVNWKTNTHSFGSNGSMENPWLLKAAELNQFNGKVCINPEAAERLGIKDGDIVNVESSDSGESITGPAFITSTMHKDVIGISGIYGLSSPFVNPAGKGGLHFNKLMSSDAKDIDPISASFDGVHYVRVTKA